VGVVFDAKTKVGRAVADKQQDKIAPYCGNINTGGIDSASFLIPVSPGIDTELVHSDRGRQVYGNLNETHTGSVTRTVLQNDTHNVTGNRTETISTNNSLTVGGNQDWTITGSHMGLYTGPKTETLVSPRNELHSSPDSNQDPTSKMRILGVDFEKKDQDFAYTFNSFEIHGMSNEINYIFKNEATTLNNEVKVLLDYATVLGVSIEPKVSEVELKPLKVWLEGAEAGAEGGKATAGVGVGVPPNVPTCGSK
jgi:hypothetical protein